MEAARAKTAALAMLHATATAFGVKEAHHGLNDFLSRMDAVIAAGSPAAESDPGQPTREEIEYFERIERIALANAAKQKAHE
jgi:hypothetical protein